MAADPPPYVYIQRQHSVIVTYARIHTLVAMNNNTHKEIVQQNIYIDYTSTIFTY